jgi:predicted PurR-regulated permease PerM
MTSKPVVEARRVSWMNPLRRRDVRRERPVPSASREADGTDIDPVEGADPESSERAVVTVALDRRSLRWALVMGVAAVLALLAIVWAWGAVAHFAFNILLAWLIAVSFEPVVRWLCDHGFRRGVATAAVAVSGALAVLGCIALFGGVLASQVAELVTALPNLVDEAVGWVNETFGTAIDPTALTATLNITPDQVTGVAGGLAGGLLGGLLGLAVSVAGIVFDLVTVVVFAIYLSASAPQIKRFVASWLPPARQVTFIRVWDISVSKAGGFLLSKLVLAAISAVFHIGFFYLIDVPFWLPMGLFAGLVSQFIPTVGTYIGVALPALFAAFTDPWDILWIAVFATAYQQVENYILTPRISTKTMDINSGIALAAVFVGAALFGPIGAVIGIPIVAIVIAVTEAYGRRYALHPIVERRAG